MLSVQSILGFNGINVTQSDGSTPPDSDGAVGPNSFIETINTSLAIYNKTLGVPIAGGGITRFSTFFSSLGTAGFLFDPVCVYNDVTQRFGVGMVDETQDSSGNETDVHLDFAISKTSNPTLNASDWNMFRYDTNDKIGASILLSDYPKIGYNADGYVVSFNMFLEPGDLFDHESVFGIANDGTSTGMRRMPVSGNDFTLAPASMHGSAPGAPMWFVTSAGFNGSINVIRLDNPFSAAAPTVTEVGVNVASFDLAPIPRQPGGLIGGNLANFGNVFFFSGLRTVAGVTHLVSADTVGTAGGTASQVRWYDINVTGATPTLIQEGAENPNPATTDTYLPEADIGPDGSIALNYSESGTNENMSMYVTARLPTDPLGTMETPILAVTNPVVLNGFGRIGDYSFTSIDPSDGSFWAINMYAGSFAAPNWATWIQHFSLTGQIVVTPVSGNVTIRVDPTNSASVQVISNITGGIITTRPNSALQRIDVTSVGISPNVVVIIDERNGIVNLPVTVQGGGLPGDQMAIIGKNTADNLVITPTSATSANVTYGTSPKYTFQNVARFTFHGAGNAAKIQDTLGGATMMVNGFTEQYDGGTPLTLNGVASLKVTDASASGNDTINVVATSVPTSIGNSNGASGDVINVGSDAPDNAFGLLTGIVAPLTVAPSGGKNTLVVCDAGSMTANLTFGLTSSKISNPDLINATTTLPNPISYSAIGGTLNVVLDGSVSVPTTFNVSSTAPAGNSVTLNGGAIPAGTNVFNLDSSLGMNAGRLNNLPAAITVNGAGADSLEINDHGTIGAYNYSITPTADGTGELVAYDRLSSPSPAIFGGVTFFGIPTMQLDATEQPNTFAVTPIISTAIKINAYGHGTGTSAGANNLAVSLPFGITKTNTPPPHNGSISLTDGTNVTQLSYTNIDNFTIPPLSFPILAVGADAGTASRPVVSVYNAQSGAPLLNPLTGLPVSFTAYESSYTGGVSVEVGYFDGTGQQEIAVAPGQNHAPIVKVFDAYGNLKFQFQAYASNFTGGIALAAGNVENLSKNGHEIDDIVTAPEHGVSDIRVFHNQFTTTPATPMTLLREFTAWSPTFIGGSTVAVANIKPNLPGFPLSWADIIVASGRGMTGTINVYDVTFKKSSYTPFETFLPFGAGFRGGVNVSAINPVTNSNVTVPTIIASQGTSGTSQVVVLNGLTGAVESTTTAFTGLGSNAAVHTTARVINGTLYVFAAQGTGGRSGKIVRIEPLAPAIVDFLLGTDPSNLG